MNRLQGIPFYNFSATNRYASNYNVAYKRAVETENKITEAENSPNTTRTEIEKLEKDLKKWENEVKNCSNLAKIEENKLEKQNNVGTNINFLA